MDRPLSKPPRLRAGDTVGLVAPSSPLLDLRDIARARRVLTGLGFVVKEGRYIRRRQGFLAGEDSLRKADLEAMFGDAEVRGIFCLRGGYGSARLLNLLDWELISANPKVFIGHSDLTALLVAIHQRTGLVTFWGPTAGADLGRYPTRFKLRWLIEVVGRANPSLRVPPGPRGRRRWKVISGGGPVQGRLVGGNLSIIASLMGTPFEIDTRGAVLFFEDVDEEPYRIDRMLGQLALAGKLAAARGILVGYCVNCEPAGRMKYSFRLREVLRDRLSGLGIPVLYGAAFGHEPDKITLPLGVMARVETAPPVLRLLEPAVS